MIDKIKPAEKGVNPDQQVNKEQPDGRSRRDFLRSLGRWSAAIIGVVVVEGLLEPPNADAAWINRRGSWINGGGSWVNRGGSWVNRGGGGGSWINRRGW